MPTTANSGESDYRIKETLERGEKVSIKHTVIKSPFFFAQWIEIHRSFSKLFPISLKYRR